MWTVLRVVAVLLLIATACGDGDGDGNGGGNGDGGADRTTVDRTGEAACSAADLPPEPAEQPELPAPVAAMRAQIVEAAVACDFQRLEELALEGSGTFTYSFGTEGDPAGYWRRQEQSAEPPEPLRFLVALLDRPHATVEPAGEVQYVWPSAFGYDSWQAVPQRDREALKPLYSEADFQAFERFGAYIGYRVGITADGNWRFFVAGD